MSRKTRWNALKKQKNWYSGKKTAHNAVDHSWRKVIADIATDEIVSTDQKNGSVHDFKIFKLSMRAIFAVGQRRLPVVILVTQKQQNSVQKSKNPPLTSEQKSYNRELPKERIVIENIDTKIKVFKMMSERYRNR